MAVRIELWNVPLMLISDLIHISIRLVSGCARALRFGSLHALTADQFVFVIDGQCELASFPGAFHWQYFSLMWECFCDGRHYGKRMQ